MDGCVNCQKYIKRIIVIIINNIYNFKCNSYISILSELRTKRLVQVVYFIYYHQQTVSFTSCLMTYIWSLLCVKCQNSQCTASLWIVSEVLGVQWETHLGLKGLSAWSNEGAESQFVAASLKLETPDRKNISYFTSIHQASLNNEGFWKSDTYGIWEEQILGSVVFWVRKWSHQSSPCRLQKGKRLKDYWYTVLMFYRCLSGKLFKGVFKNIFWKQNFSEAIVHKKFLKCIFIHFK